MARMLQALKNLEARTVRPAVDKTPVEKLKEPVSKPEPVLATPVDVASSEAIVPTAMQVVDKLDAAVAHELAGFSTPESLAMLAGTPEYGFSDFAFFGQKVNDGSFEKTAEEVAFRETGFRAAPAPLRAEEFPQNESVKTAVNPGKMPVAPSGRPVLRVPVQEPCALERQVRRTLSDPTRSQPIVELVDRLERDLEQSGSKIVTFVTLGGEKASFASLLHVATILAEREGGVLLVDGDSSRCWLSAGMEQGQTRGLCEMVGGTAASKECIVKTATGGLSFLPAGQLRHYDFSTAGSGLESSLAELSGEFDRVLIDAGRAGEPGVAALARQADATYLVIELGAVETSAAQTALAELRASGARVLGCIAI
jgi:Mrp family chromosome partitioning ATPase